MKNSIPALVFLLAAGSAATLSASAICPSTPNTTSNCDFLLTIGATGAVTVSEVNNASAFNGPVNFIDGTSDPGGDGSLVGVVNNYSEPLMSLTLLGKGADAGIFDFSFNGICVYANAAYCTNAQTGYEGPTTTFSNLRSTALFETTEGNVSFNPYLTPGNSTYFAIEDAPADIMANGGLSVSNVAFAPEPSGIALVFAGVSFLLMLFRSKFLKIT